MQSSYKIDILKKFAKFTGIHMCLSLFYNKLEMFLPTILLNKRLQHRCFPVNVAKFLTIPFQLNTSSLRQNFDPSYLAILFWPAPRFYGPTPPAHFFFVPALLTPSFTTVPPARPRCPPRPCCFLISWVLSCSTTFEATHICHVCN